MTSTIHTSFSLPVLRLGSIGSEVTFVQRLLNNAGYGVLVEDGVFGSRTETAVKQFQNDQNLTVDGVVGSQTWKALLPQTIRKGSIGHDVERLQNILKEIGHGHLVVDGIFGSNTEEAVKQFQKGVQLDADGIVGTFTWYFVLSALIND